MGIDHIGYTVKNISKTKEMFKALLGVLDYKVNFEGYGYVGFGRNGNNELWLGEPNEKHPTIPTDIHICFKAESKEQVEEFYKVGLEVGFKDNGAPGIREIYAPNYFAAFLLDDDGNNIEAVFKK